MEKTSVKKWFSEENPARSGDKKDICWMVKSKGDFYHENYRNVGSQCEMIKWALDVFGDELRDEAMDNRKDPFLKM